MNPEFDIEYYVKVIELLSARAVELEILHDKFFDLQDALTEQPEPVQQAVLDHPQAVVMAANLASLQAVLNRLKV